MRHLRGLTIVEVLACVVCALVLVCLMIPLGARVRGDDLRSACSNNCRQVLKQCHLYSDTSPNLMEFPIYIGSKDFKSEKGDGHTSNGRLAISQLYNGYIRDHRFFACPAKATDTSVLKPYKPVVSPIVADFSNYGYDPGHTPFHGYAGVFADLGDRDPKNGNSLNHGAGGPGQNVATVSGAVEWWVESRRKVRNNTDAGQEFDDDIHASDLSEKLAEEFETHITK